MTAGAVGSLGLLSRVRRGGSAQIEFGGGENDGELCYCIIVSQKTELHIRHGETGASSHNGQ